MAFEILEHTADVGVRATGATLPDAVREVTLGLLNITGTWLPNGGRAMPVEIEGDDLGSLVVDWLGEVLWLQDAHDSVVAGLEVTEASQKAFRGTLSLRERGDLVPEGTAVKAITYHQLKVEESDEGWTIQIYVDV